MKTGPLKRDPSQSPVQIPAFNESWAITNADGRIEGKYGPTAEPAAALLLRAYLDVLQRPSSPDPTDENWQTLPSKPKVSEYSVWLTGALAEDVLRGSLKQQSINLSDWQTWSDEARTRAVVEAEGAWVAVTRDRRTFDTLINRNELVERIARKTITST